MQFFVRLTVALLVFTTSQLFAQSPRPANFAKETPEFLSQMNVFLSASKSDVLDKTFKEFEGIFRTNFTTLEAERVIVTCNTMLGRRLNPNPHFQAYLNTLLTFKQTAPDEKSFAEWHVVVDSLLVPGIHQVQQFTDFMNFSKGYFSNKMLATGDAGATSWQTVSTKIHLRYKNKQPYVHMEEGNLIARRKDDSLRISNTTGTYYPLKFEWIGKGGQVSWKRIGMDSTVLTELGNYKLDTRMGIYTTDQAFLTFPAMFGNQRIPGKFSDKISSDSKSTFPKFSSDNKDLEIKNFAEGVRFRGGFNLEGTTIYGEGSENKKAVIEILDRNKNRVFKGTAKRFSIRRNQQIAGEGVESVFYFKKDSIFHPSANFRYTLSDKVLQLYRGERGSDKYPFFSSNHQMNFDANNVKAFLAKDSVVIGERAASFTSKEPMKFESLQFFSKREFEGLQSIATYNPLIRLKLLSDELGGTREVEAEDFARKLNSTFNSDNITSLLFDLTGQGFIRYNMDTKMITILDKVYHYVNASVGRTDYDQLRILSKIDSANAVLDLKNNNILVRGVNFLELSRRQQVGIDPDSSRLTLSQNRNIRAKGTLKAGFSELRSNKLFFDYSKFSVNSDSIKYWRLFVPDKRPSENKGQELNPYGLTSDIEKFKATLIIDAEGNKSGKDEVALFPSLNSQSPSYVYYDRKYNKFVKDTVYKRDSFFFELKPFNFNRLDDYIKSDIVFKGKLVSAQVFPDFDEQIGVMDDYSLGFKHKTPEKGYPVYKVKGRFLGEINLSNEGFQGKGNIQYLGAALASEDIMFKPKQMLASAKAFDLAEKRTKGEEVPQAHGELVKLDWRPYRDSMYIRSEKEAFKLFKSGEHTLAGMLTLTPGGLKGNGVLDWPAASMKSKQFNFGANSLKADTTSLNIKAEEAGAIAIQSDRLKGDVDFDQQIGRFKSIDEFLTTKMPFNQYETSMNEFIWEMNNTVVNFKADESKMGIFTSLHPDQDSLRFNGKKASYDLKTYLLTVKEVPHIKAADAMIIPDSGVVLVRPKAVIDTLKNAVIVCDTLNKNHRINRATVSILGKKEYRATGFYEYNVADKKQEIEFENILGTRVGKGQRSEKRSATRAEGLIEETDSFIIDHKTSFYGKIKLFSESVNLTFEGFAKLNADKLPQQNWFTIRSSGDKKDLTIRYDSPKNIEAIPLETGFYLSKEVNFVYPSVMMPLMFRKDRAILPTKGILKYDKTKDQFLFGDSLKLVGKSYEGNKLIFHNKDAKVEGEGKLGLCTALKVIKLDAAGTIVGKFENIPDSLLGKTPPPPVDIDVISGVILRMPDKLMKIVQNEMESSSSTAKDIAYLTDLEYYRRRFFPLLPDDSDVEKSMVEFQNGVLDLPKKFNPYTFLFTGLKMRWDMDYQSFVSTKDQVGLISMNGGNMVGKEFTTHIEYKMPGNDDDRVYIYLKLPNDIYYYFGYKAGIMEINSNDNRFMDEAAKMKKTELFIKGEDGEVAEIQVVEANRAQAFVQRIKAAGKGGK
jgi:hypothetical protein